jgi:hypothetical protein
VASKAFSSGVFAVLLVAPVLRLGVALSVGGLQGVEADGPLAEHPGPHVDRTGQVAGPVHHQDVDEAAPVAGGDLDLVGLVTVVHGAVLVSVLVLGEGERLVGHLESPGVGVSLALRRQYTRYS